MFGHKRARLRPRLSALRECSQLIQQRARRLHAHLYIFGKQLHHQRLDIARNVRTQLVGWCDRGAQNF